MVFNATFNNISFISCCQFSWRRKPEYTEKNTDKTEHNNITEMLLLKVALNTLNTYIPKHINVFILSLMIRVMALYQVMSKWQIDDSVKSKVVSRFNKKKRRYQITYSDLYKLGIVILKSRLCLILVKRWYLDKISPE